MSNYNMFGASFSQFLQPDNDNNDNHNQNYYQQQQYTMPQPNIIPPSIFKPFSIDQCENQIDMLLTKNFNANSSYPNDFSNVNPFCPICGKFVKCTQHPQIYQSKKFNKNFLAHGECLLRHQANNMLNAIYQQSEQSQILPFGMKQVQHRSIPIGGKQYFLQMKIIHTLSDLVLLKQSTRLQSQSQKIHWQIHLNNQSQPYIPTIICFPYSDFKLSLQLTNLSSGEKTLHKSYINLAKIKYNEIKVVTACIEEEMKVQLRMFYSLDEKEKLTKEMNFKYRHDITLPVPIVEVAAIEVHVPDEDDDEFEHGDYEDSVIGKVIGNDDDDDQDQDNTNNNNNGINNNHNNYNNNMSNNNRSQTSTVEMFGSNHISNNYNNNNNNNNKYGLFTHYNSNNNNNYRNHLTSSSPPTPITNYNQYNTNNNNTINPLSLSDNISQRSYEKQKPNFQLLINNKQALSLFVRHNSQSRQFQTFLSQATSKQVDVVIQTLYMELPELITHQYANYMVQKLFNVCSYTQRLKVMQRLHQEIADIVRNKQGTHTIQALVKFFTNDEEYKLMCESIKENFFQLSCHPNATHFIQKIIGLFPIIHTYQFFEYAQKNFIDFALDKNAMCVIKHMMKLIAQLEKNNPSQKIKQLTTQAKKKFINEVTFCIDKIIQDAFGNYIIQFCYELFGEQKCSGITEMITQRFPQFAIQKYSSSVIHKCITTYWTREDTFHRLKQCLTSDSILQLFRNKDGNKILLEIMQRHDGLSIRDKIYNQLLLGQPTKFNHDRWGVVMGIRSGVVGTEYGSFSDAVKKGRKGGKGWQ